jgi:prepilin-type N-terminal cleavage/methylation domain-containing protein
MRAVFPSVLKKTSRTSRIGLGLFGFVLAISLIYNQRSFNAHSSAYDQALAQTTTWDNSLSDILTIKGHVLGLAESVSHLEGKPADSFPPIEAAVSELQSVWMRYASSVPANTRTRVGRGVDSVVSAAMKTAEELRRHDLTEAREQARNVVQRTAEVSPILIQLERQLAVSRQGSETDRLKALEGMSFGQAIDVSVLFALGCAFVGILVMALPGLARRINPQPRPVVATTSRGFSLIEVLMVVAITLVLSTIAIANIAAVVSSSRIRAGISSMSGLFQNCRMMAVKKNKTMTAHVTTVGSASLLGYVKEATDTSELSTADSQVKWEAPVIRMASPTGPGAPSVIDATMLGFTPQTGDISFNSRGLPCAYSSGVCTNHGFLYYFKDTSRDGGKGWAALSVSPAGKIRKWFWNVNSWS